MDILYNITTSGVTAEMTTFGDEVHQETVMTNFFKNYGNVHGYIANTVCIFGVISNVLNIIVLTRRHMITPTNCILTALAIADLLTMLTYLVYATYFYIATEPKPEYSHSKGWMYFIMIHNHFIITCHNMAMWFTVTLAVFRYIFVCHHTIAGRLCSLQRAIMTIITVVVATILLCIPNYFLYKVIPVSQAYPNLSGYWILDSDLMIENPSYKIAIFWFFGVIMKVAPCILLSVVSTLIILMMKRASERRVRLLKQTRASDHDVNHEHNRTTYMLVSVVLFFVITEFPQGILAMISGLNDHFFDEIYSNLGDVMDLLVLLNSAVNFILYCIMSQQFRDTFRSLFVGEWMCYYKQVRKMNGNTNGYSTAYSTVRTEATMVWLRFSKIFTTFIIMDFTKLIEDFFYFICFKMIIKYDNHV